MTLLLYITNQGDSDMTQDGGPPWHPWGMMTLIGAKISDSALDYITTRYVENKGISHIKYTTQMIYIVKWV